MGEEELPPALVDREREMGRIRRALGAPRADGRRLLLIRGEAGVGKTRLVQEVGAEAAKLGCTVVWARARAESTAPYHLWREPLDRLGVEQVLEELPPPRLRGLYLLGADGRVLARVERNREELARPTFDIAALASSGDGPHAESPSDRGFSVITEGDLCFLVVKRAGFRLAAAMEGREDEALLADMRALADAVGHGDLRADSPMEQALQEILTSGKYEGVDYAKADPKLRQLRLFRNVALALAREAEGHRYVILFDDLQWADPSSLALLHYVARNLAQSEAVLLGTCRVEDGGVRPHLQDVLQSIHNEGLLEEVDLQGLSRLDLGSLAKAFIGPHELPETFLDFLWRETGGNPLIVREVLRRLEGEHAIRIQGAAKRLRLPMEELSIPRRVREALRARLDRIPREDRRLLEAAAACGSRFTTSMVAKLVGEPEGKVLNGIGAIAGAHGFLRHGKTGFTFDHPAIQEVLYEEMAESLRRVYHQEAADWLELAGGPVEDIAEHLYRAGDKRAVGPLRKAADGARERYANEEAIRFYAEAAELEADREVRREILVQLGSVLELVGRYGDALDRYLEALMSADQNETRAELLVRVGDVLRLQGKLDEALSSCNEAMSLIRDTDSQVEVKALDAIGIIHFERGTLDQAAEFFEKTVQINEASRDRTQLPISLNNLGNALHALGLGERALACYLRGRELSERDEDPGMIAKIAYNLGNFYVGRGERKQALDSFRQCIAAAERTGDAQAACHGFGGIGLMHDLEGDFDAALGYYGKALAMAERVGVPGLISVSLNAIGWILEKRGEYDGALDHLERSLAITEGAGARAQTAVTLDRIGMLHVLRGEPRRGIAHLEKSIAVRREAGDEINLADTWWRLAEARLDLGEVEESIGLCQTVLRNPGGVAMQENTAQAHRVLGNAYRDQRLWQEAAANLEESLRAFKEYGVTPELGITHLDFAIMWEAAGDARQAREHCESAIRIFKLEKASGPLQQASRLLAQLPSTPPAHHTEVGV